MENNEVFHSRIIPRCVEERNNIHVEILCKLVAKINCREEEIFIRGMLKKRSIMKFIHSRNFAERE